MKERKFHFWTKEELDLLKSLVDKGTPYKDVAERFQMSKSAVHAKSIRMGWKYIGKVNHGKRNGNWNENVGYAGIHKWVRRNRPAPENCEICGVKRERLDCANLSGEYKRDLNDWIYLCRRCHMKTDDRIKNWNLTRNLGIVNGINRPPPRPKNIPCVCIVCGTQFMSVSATKKTCGINCYKRIWRQSKKVQGGKVNV
jgi:hypothetical protein